MGMVRVNVLPNGWGTEHHSSMAMAQPGDLLWRGPVDDAQFTGEPGNAWAFFSRQNLGALLILWTFWITRKHNRTPLEAIMPRLNGQLAGLPGARRRETIPAP